MIAQPYSPNIQDGYDSKTSKKDCLNCYSCFTYFLQSDSSEKIRVIYTNEKKDNSKLSILTKSLSTFNSGGIDMVVHSASPTPSPLSSEEVEEIFSATSWSKDAICVNNSSLDQKYLTILIAFYDAAKLECEKVRLPTRRIAESLTEIKSMISGSINIEVGELIQILEKIVEDILSLQLKADSEETDISTTAVTGSESQDSENLVPLLGLEEMKVQLRKLKIITSESERNRMMLEDEKESVLLSAETTSLAEASSLKFHKDLGNLECDKIDTLDTPAQRKDKELINQRSQMLHADLQKQLRMVNSNVTDEKKADLVRIYLRYLRSKLDLKET